jgi:hypothetical protein
MIDSSTTSFAFVHQRVSLSEKIDSRLDLQRPGKERIFWQLYHYILHAPLDMDINISNLNIAILNPFLISPYYPLISLLPSDTPYQF